MRYKVNQEAYPYSASIFEVEEKTGHVVTRVNLNEEPNLQFSVSTHTHSLTYRSPVIHNVHYIVFPTLGRGPHKGSHDESKGL